MVRAYIAHVTAQYAVPTIEVDRLLMILKIYEWQQRRFILKRARGLDNLATLKHGVREAERFLEDFADGKNLPSDAIELVLSIILELTKEIIHTEELYPDMRFIFDRERAHYRTMKNEADEALLLH